MVTITYKNVSDIDEYTLFVLNRLLCSNCIGLAIDPSLSPCYQVLQSKISDSASDVSDSEAELKEATSIREGDNKAFSAVEQALVKEITHTWSMSNRQ